MASSTAQRGLNLIQTAAELVERYQKSSAGRTLGKLEQAWLAAIFKIFATGPDGHTLSSSDLAEVLTLFFPEQCASVIQEAAPILHRSLLSLGSFPYLSNPAPYLTLQTFQAALIILTNRDDSKIRRNMDNEDEDLYQNRLDARKRRMIFQSVTTRAGDTGSGGGNTSRSAENDEDLREVYEYVVSHNYQDQDLGHTIIHLPGPELAALENFPSSQSRKLDRSISCQDFKALVKILLVTQLFDTVDPEKATENLDQLNHIVESIIKGFVKEKNDVDWSTYEKGVSQSVPHLYEGLDRIFGPFILVKADILSQFESSAKNEAASLLKSTFLVSNPATPRLAGVIANIPLLCQLGTFLPIQSTSIISLGRVIQINEVRDWASTQDNPAVLLILGTFSQSPSASATSRVGLGFYMEEGALHTGFQFQPAHEVYASDPKHNLTNVLELIDKTTDIAALRKSLGSQGKTGSGHVFHIETVEAIEFGDPIDYWSAFRVPGSFPIARA